MVEQGNPMETPGGGGLTELLQKMSECQMQFYLFEI